MSDSEFLHLKNVGVEYKYFNNCERALNDAHTFMFLKDTMPTPNYKYCKNLSEMVEDAQKFGHTMYDFCKAMKEIHAEQCLDQIIKDVGQYTSQQSSAPVSIPVEAEHFSKVRPTLVSSDFDLKWFQEVLADITNNDTFNFCTSWVETFRAGRQRLMDVRYYIQAFRKMGEDDIADSVSTAAGIRVERNTERQAVPQRHVTVPTRTPAPERMEVDPTPTRTDVTHVQKTVTHSSFQFPKRSDEYYQSCLNKLRKRATNAAADKSHTTDQSQTLFACNALLNLFTARHDWDMVSLETFRKFDVLVDLVALVSNEETISTADEFVKETLKQSRDNLLSTFLARLQTTSFGNVLALIDPLSNQGSITVNPRTTATRLRLYVDPDYAKRCYQDLGCNVDQTQLTDDESLLTNLYEPFAKSIWRVKLKGLNEDFLKCILKDENVPMEVLAPLSLNSLENFLYPLETTSVSRESMMLDVAEKRASDVLKEFRKVPEDLLKYFVDFDEESKEDNIPMSEYYADLQELLEDIESVIPAPAKARERISYVKAVRALKSFASTISSHCDDYSMDSDCE